MVVRQGLRSVSIDLVDAVFRPSAFVEAQTSTYSVAWAAQASQVLGLLTVYLINLALYAIPLTLAGFGIGTVGDPPSSVVGLLGTGLVDPAVAWQFSIAFLQNSAYITAAVAVTLLTYHGGVLLTFESRGFTQSLHTVVYSSSIYLAGLFSAVWYLTTNAGVAGARLFVREIQLVFVYSVIDVMGADLRLPLARPERVTLGELSFQGELLLATILVLLGYFFYSLYLGSRVNHQMAPEDAATILVAVATAPVVYVAASVVAATTPLP